MYVRQETVLSSQIEGTKSQLEALGYLEETTGQQRNRRYRFEPYLELFEAYRSGQL